MVSQRHYGLWQTDREPVSTRLQTSPSDQAYRDGGMGISRPAIVQLGSGPVPGLCRGLRLGLEGMAVGGKRTLLVPPDFGFGSQ